MKPFAAVQALLRCDENGKPTGIAGSCFRLWSPIHFITAGHCVRDIQPTQLKVMNILDDNNDLRCVNIDRHPVADIAVIKVDGVVPSQFETFKITEKDFSYGTQVHCFGFMPDGDKETSSAPARVIGGIIQRDFLYDDGKYKSLAVELSVPIPRGTSGGPAFFADKADVAMGVALATIKTEIVVSSFEEYENDKVKEKERISEIIRYGVILRLYPVKDWLEKVIPK